MRFINTYFSLFLLCISTLTVHAGQEQCKELFNEGVEAYLLKEYQNSSNKFEQIIDTCGSSKELLYNLGNAYYEQNLIGKSILNYERAQKLFEEDSKITNNLKLARKAIKRPIASPIFKLSSIYNSLSLNEWAILSIFSLFSAALCYLFFFFSMTKYKALFLYTSLFFAAVFLLSLSLGYSKKNDVFFTDYGIIIEEDVSLRSKNEASSPVIMKLSEGIKVSVKIEQESWVHVALPNHKMGWIKKEYLTKI